MSKSLIDSVIEEERRSAGHGVDEDFQRLVSENVSEAERILDFIFEGWEQECRLQILYRGSYIETTEIKPFDNTYLSAMVLVSLKLEEFDKDQDLSRIELIIRRGTPGETAEPSKIFCRKGLARVRGLGRSFRRFVHMVHTSEHWKNELTEIDQKNLRGMGHYGRLLYQIPIAVDRCLSPQILWESSDLGISPATGLAVFPVIFDQTVSDHNLRSVIEGSI